MKVIDNICRCITARANKGKVAYIAQVNINTSAIKGTTPLSKYIDLFITHHYWSQLIPCGKQRAHAEG